MLSVKESPVNHALADRYHVWNFDIQRKQISSRRKIGVQFTSTSDSVGAPMESIFADCPVRNRMRGEAKIGIDYTAIVST